MDVRRVTISARQQYVLANLERVCILPYKTAIRSSLLRHQLDGVECTAQITGLIVKGLVKTNLSGRLQRMEDAAVSIKLPNTTKNENLFGHAITNIQGRFLSADQSYISMLGYEPADLFKSHIQDVTFEEDWRNYKQLLDHLMASDQCFIICKRYKRRDKSVIWVENRVSHLLQPTGERLIVACSWLLPTKPSTARDQLQKIAPTMVR